MKKRRKIGRKSLLKDSFYIFTVLGLLVGTISPLYWKNTFYRYCLYPTYFMISLPLHIVLHEIGHILGGFISGGL